MKKTRAGYVMVDENDPQWLRFWNAYPKRVAKKDARKAWNEMNPTPAQVDQMVQALSWQITQPAWLKDGGQFIPYPASWLRAGRWEDEPLAIPQMRKQTIAAMTGAAAFVMGGHDGTR